MRWYITAAAVKQFLGILGYDQVEGFDDREEFDQAAKWLSEICETARFKKDQGRSLVYEAKTKVDGRTVRLELYVSTDNREEGPDWQLVRVRYKGGSRSGRKREKRRDRDQGR